MLMLTPRRAGTIVMSANGFGCGSGRGKMDDTSNNAVIKLVLAMTAAPVTYGYKHQLQRIHELMVSIRTHTGLS